MDIINQGLLSLVDAIHPKCENELQYFVEKYGSGFSNILLKRLMTLNLLGKNAIEQRANFELLKHIHDVDIYSMRVKARGFNIRILYTYYSGQKSFLLCAFYEKSGKSHTGYKKHVDLAKSRLEEEYHE